jgi:hypothetical protein
MYVSFTRDLSRPSEWTAPEKILDVSAFQGCRYYPQVIGTDARARQTDKIAGQTARFFITGKSRWEMVFLRPGEAAPASMPAE